MIQNKYTSESLVVTQSDYRNLILNVMGNVTFTETKIYPWLGKMIMVNNGHIHSPVLTCLFTRSDFMAREW